MATGSYERTLEQAGGEKQGGIAKGKTLCSLGSYERTAEMVAGAPREDAAELGPYDLTKYYLGGCKEEDASELADYVGPVVVERSPGKGRGVFLTEAVSKGQVLIVSNAIGLVLGGCDLGLTPSREMKSLEKKVIKACKSSPIKLAQLLCLREHRYPKNKLEEAIELEVKKFVEEYMPEEGYLAKLHFCKFFKRQKGYCRLDELTVPSMDIFRPNDCDAMMHAAKEKISEVFGDFHLEDGSIPEELLVKEVVSRIQTEASSIEPLATVPYLGLWVLPSFMNHSCMGNVSLHRVGTALLVVASRDMQAGTEIERPYGFCYRPTSTRMAKTDFCCGCRRCEVEPRVPKLGNCVFDCPRPLDVEAEMDALSLSDEQKSYLRTSYIHSYLGHTEDLSPELAEEVMRALHFTVPGHSSALRFMAVLAGVAGSASAMALLQEECIARVGRLAPEVLQAIIEDALSKGLGQE